MSRRENPTPLVAWKRGIRTAIRNNASAYAYSAVITATFGIAQRQIGAPSLADIFAFVIGAGISFIVVEAAVSNFFRQNIRPEGSDIVVLGSALSIFSITGGLATATGLTWLVGGLGGWFLASFGATVTYLAISAVEMALAILEQERSSGKR